VAIVLLDWAVETWKAAGSQWRAWNSRIVSATLKTTIAKSLGLTVSLPKTKYMHGGWL